MIETTRAVKVGTKIYSTATENFGVVRQTGSYHSIQWLELKKATTQNAQGGFEWKSAIGRRTSIPAAMVEKATPGNVHDSGHVFLVEDMVYAQWESMQRTHPDKSDAWRDRETSWVTDHFSVLSQEVCR